MDNVTENLEFVYETETSFNDRKIISFKGKYCQESIDYLRKQNKKMGIRLALFVTIPMIIISAIMLIGDIHWYWPALFLFLAVFGGVGFGVLVAHFGNFADQIDIENNIIYITNEKGSVNVSQDIENVQCVYNHDKFYYIKFFGNRFPYGVCQKDLLVKGTLEDFENLFAGKIIRQ